MEASRNPAVPASGISVIICCYNSATRLPETLRHLARQQIASPTPWEIVIVDNASTDETAQVACDHWPQDSSVPLRVVREPQAGLSHARRCGVAEARYDIISFIDDDNWVAPDWIERVRGIFAAHPEIGVCGGKAEPAPEIEPPAWFERLRGFYATGSPYERNGEITDLPGTLLWGAGLNMRTCAIRELFGSGFSFLMSGRAGQSTGAGEDTEICFALREAGWRFWYDDALFLRHFIPKERLSWNYALRLMEGMGKASTFFDLYLMALRRPPFDQYPAWKKTWLFQFLKAGRQSRALLRAHRAECLGKTEGSWNALQFQAVQGRIAMLRSLSGRYETSKLEIAKTMAAMKTRKT